MIHNASKIYPRRRYHRDLQYCDVCLRFFYTMHNEKICADKDKDYCNVNDPKSIGLIDYGLPLSSVLARSERQIYGECTSGIYNHSSRKPDLEYYDYKMK